MAPLVYLVRHAEGEHNVNDASHIRDAPLTATGKEQCRVLRDTFPLHDTITTVISSPLRRAIQTTVLSFGPTLSRPDVRFVLLPRAQEVSAKTCDVGFPREELQKQISSLYAGQDVGFDLGKIEYEAVEDGWNSKTGYWAADKPAVQKRAADLRAWLYARPEPHILLVTHGAFLHYLTEDWTGDDPKRGTAYFNCEVRQFTFTPGSSEQEAHIVETDKSKSGREQAGAEKDTHVLAEMEAVEATGHN